LLAANVLKVSSGTHTGSQLCVYMCCSGYFLLISANVIKVNSGTHTGSVLCVYMCCSGYFFFRKRIKGKQRHTHRGLLCVYMCCTGSFLLLSASVLKVSSGKHIGSLLCDYMCCSG
jgi:hypothetical protein